MPGGTSSTALVVIVGPPSLDGTSTDGTNYGRAASCSLTESSPRCSCRRGAGAFSCAVAKASRGGQNSHRTRQWTQRRGHRLRSTNGCSTGRSTGTATHTVSGHGTPAYRRRQRRRERFPTAPPREKREGKLYGSPLLALPGYGASAVGAGTGESPGPEPAATRPWCL